MTLNRTATAALPDDHPPDDLPSDDALPDAGQLVRRILNSLRAGTFELETFIGLAGIEVTDRIPTAAVTTGVRSRFLLNPSFVAAHCRSDDHLFMLVMHELLHVLLAHTRLYPRPTVAHNIAFDAVINAELVHRFPEREHRGFFERYYRAEVFPERLLRPPEGWPARPRYRGPGPQGTETLLRMLYPTVGRPAAYWPDLVALLRDEDVDAPDLLGDHDATDEGYRSVVDNEYTGEAFRDMVNGWPLDPPSTGAGAGGQRVEWFISPSAVQSPTKEFEAVLRRACRPTPDGVRERTPVDEPTPVVSVLPDRRDRRRLARVRLGLPTLLHDGRANARVRRVEPPASARVYLDVSGSMNGYLPDLLGPLTAVVARRLATLWQFSTDVMPLPLAELRTGRLSTTGGTDLDVVLEHALADRTVTSIVVVTDGYVADPPRELTDALEDRRITVEAVVPHGGATWPLGKVATVTVLPPASTEVRR